MIFIAVAAHYLFSHQNELSQLRGLSYGYFAILALIAFLYIHAQGLIIKVMVEVSGIRLSFRDWFGIFIVSMLGNYVLPFTGVGLRAVYLKSLNFSYTDFAATSVAGILIELIVFAVGGCLSLIYLPAKGRSEVLLLWMLVAFLLALVCFWFVPKLSTVKNKILNRVVLLSNRWHGIRNNRRMLTRLIALNSYLFVLNSLMFYVAILSLGLNVPFMSTFLAACLSDYAYFIRLTPAALGTFDAASVYSLAVFGLSLTQGLLIVIIVRLSLMIWVFTLGPLFAFSLSKRISDRRKIPYPA